MSGKKEKAWEKVSRPVRINPVILSGVIFFGAVGYTLTGSESFLRQLGGYASMGAGTLSVKHYIEDIRRYYRECRLLERYGFDLEHAKKRMKHYCGRQGFYVACTKFGFREEVIELIKETPSDEKKFSFIPHF